MPVRSPWVRTRLRTAPLAALLTAVLAFCAVFLAAALPRELDRSADQALTASLQRVDQTDTQIQADAAPRQQTGPARAADLDVALAALTPQLSPHLPLDAHDVAYGERSRQPRELPDPGLARPDGVDPRLNLLYLGRTDGHLHLVDGHWPNAAPRHGVLQVALSRATARTLGVRVGQLLHTNGLMAPRIDVQVVGLYTPLEPDGRFWAGLSCATHACLLPLPGGDDPPRYWLATALIGASSVAVTDTWSGGLGEDFWWLPVDYTRLHGDTLALSRADLSSWMGGPTQQAAAEASGRYNLLVDSPLLALLDRAAARQAAIRPLTAIGPAGLAGVVAVVLCLAAGLTAERRAAELRLLRARGGSRRDLVLRLLGESLSTVLPAGLLATWLALVLLPTPRLLPALVAAVAALLFALLAVPVRTLLRDTLALRPARRRRGRRLVAELALLAAAVAAVAEVRRRGVGGLDPLQVAAPLLLAAVGAVLLARCQPLLVGALARAAGRGSGAVGFLGLARAARGTGGARRPSVLPLLALTLAVTTAGFGAATLRSVSDSRSALARLAVGGDASVVAPPGATLPPGLARSLAALPGVSLGTAFWEQDDVTVVKDGAVQPPATLVAVDPQTYARLARAVGRGAFDPAQLTTPSSGSGSPVPGLVSGDLAGAGSGHGYALRLDGGRQLQVTGVGVVTGTPAVPDATATVVVLPASAVAARLPDVSRPNRWLGLGAVGDARLRAAVPAAFGTDTSAAHVAALADDPLQAAAARIFWACTVATWCFALLAVLLALVRAGPERAALLARLRTMGLRPRQGLRLILAESLPQTLTAALGGGLAATAAVLLLGPTVDLSPLVGTPVPTGLTLTAPPILEQTLIVAGLVAVAGLAEATVQGRRQITVELRAGDGR
ncbi:ABC transporter permease [Streptacidiphilus pinicola]|uniref:ABC transporter permease n=1 Tax=Streptacidiphilus pinicola TaxID=2219663 RepID=UPI00105783FB|nr:ABC transporter permease [Streptacidiphilus pinicola]